MKVRIKAKEPSLEKAFGVSKERLVKLSEIWEVAQEKCLYVSDALAPVLAECRNLEEAVLISFLLGKYLGG